MQRVNFAAGSEWNSVIKRVIASVDTVIFVSEGGDVGVENLSDNNSIRASCSIVVCILEEKKSVHIVQMYLVASFVCSERECPKKKKKKKKKKGLTIKNLYLPSYTPDIKTHGLPASPQHATSFKKEILQIFMVLETQLGFQLFVRLTIQTKAKIGWYAIKINTSIRFHSCDLATRNICLLRVPRLNSERWISFSLWLSLIICQSNYQ